MEQAHETFHLTRSVQHESSSPRVINNICTAKCDPSSNHVNANRTSLPKQYKKNVHLWIVAFLIILIVMILGIRIIYITSNSLVSTFMQLAKYTGHSRKSYYICVHLKNFTGQCEFMPKYRMCQCDATNKIFHTRTYRSL